MGGGGGGGGEGGAARIRKFSFTKNPESYLIL